MKKSLLFAGLLAMGLCSYAQNPYAYNAVTGDVNVEDLTVPVSYSLNAPAERVVVDFIQNDDVVKSVELDATALTAGDHSVDVSLDGLEPATYDLAIRVKGAELTAPVQCDPVYTFWSPYGIAIDRDPMSPHFGRVLVTECQPSVNNGSAKYWTGNVNGEGVGVGLYEFDPQLNRLKNPENTYGYAVPWTQENYGYDTWGGTGNNFALKKVKITNDGRIFVGGLDVKNGQPVYEVNPDNLAEWTPLFVGEKSKLEETGYDNRLYDEDGNLVAGYSACFAFHGEGADLKMVNLGVVRGQAFAYGNYQMFEYPIGTATSWSAAVDDVEQEVVPLSGQYTISVQNVSVDYDPNGNIWWAQYRGEPNEAQPTMKHVSKIEGEWEEDYTFITDVEGGFAFNRGGGISVSPDGTKLAFSTGNFKLTVVDVTYDEFGTPTLDMENAVTCTSTDVRGFNDIAWDYAGNLYGCDNGYETFRCFAFPRTAPSVPAGMSRLASDDPNEAITPLRAEYAVEVPLPTAVSDITAKAVVSVEYVNANGQVSNVPFEGINVVVTKYADGTKSVNKIVK